MAAAWEASAKRPAQSSSAKNRGAAGYTGAVGWIDARGDGEFAVALRAGVIDGMMMYLFGGAGIVAGSDSEAEFAETEKKLTALLGSTTLA